MHPSPFNGFFTLIRWKVSAAVTFSAFTSMVLYTGGLIPLHLIPLAGIFLLASGASALNQYQERDTDAIMERTKSRPVPAGVIMPVTALILSLALIGCGAAILFVFSSFTCFILGLANVLWYNGLYTGLKTRTAFAVVPGAVTGVVPIYMGWTDCGGHLSDPAPMLLAFFIFIWQMPHFWLLMIEYQEDYRKAGLPSMTEIFSPAQQKTVIMAWMVASSASSFLLIWFGIITNLVIQAIVIFINLSVLLFFLYRFFLTGKQNRGLFVIINIFMMTVLALIIVSAALHNL